MLHLNQSALEATSAPDYIALYDFKTHTTSRLALTNTPINFPGVFVHAIEVFESPPTPSEDGSKLDSGLITIFINSHRPIAGSDGSEGAGSVIEIFETRLGEGELKWVKTIQHDVVRTPNSMAAIGPRQVYFSNDHRRKNHWVSLLVLSLCFVSSAWELLSKSDNFSRHY
jgi:arylesterase/paraoxonase